MGRLVFSSDRDGGDLDLWMLEAGRDEPIRLTSGKGHDRGADLSPDGTMIAFNSDRDNPAGISARGSNLRWYDLYLIGTDGSPIVPFFANRTHNSRPVWSPDGGRIAFHGERLDPDGATMQIWVMPADGSETPVALTDDPVQATDPAWSPDGTRIAFDTLRHGQNADGSWNREIYVMAADGSDQVRLTDDPANDAWPAWSPDGTSIAFDSDRAGEDDIYVMAADGSDVVRLTSDPGWDSFPTWSPDGTMIAFSSGRDGDAEIYLMNADGTEQQNLTSNPGEAGAAGSRDDFPDWGS